MECEVMCVSSSSLQSEAQGKAYLLRFGGEGSQGIKSEDKEKMRMKIKGGTLSLGWP